MESRIYDHITAGMPKGARVPSVQLHSFMVNSVGRCLVRLALGIRIGFFLIKLFLLRQKANKSMYPYSVDHDIHYHT